MFNYASVIECHGYLFMRFINLSLNNNDNNKIIMRSIKKLMRSMKKKVRDGRTDILIHKAA